jgi:hypothetical protein
MYPRPTLKWCLIRTFADRLYFNQLHARIDLVGSMEVFHESKPNGFFFNKKELVLHNRMVHLSCACVNRPRVISPFRSSQ